MSVAGLNHEVIHLIELQWPSATHRVTSAGGDVVWGGQTWRHDDPVAGTLMDAGALVEGGGQFGYRSIGITVTATTRPWILSGQIARLVAVFREAARDNSTGVLTVQAATWTGLGLNFEGDTRIGSQITLELSTRAAFASKRSNEEATYGPQFQARLVGDGDLAFNATGGKIRDWFTDGITEAGGSVGGSGGYVIGQDQWRQAEIDMAALADRKSELGL
jgi:hypothetical protein